ncbi:hypothetical protein Ahy_B01g052172 isoform C [Arachis hypogaea]|uniref:Uncharacterized protein n=1 Tax=Arachis hypogaea TaxID=3818 RepID=A0A445ANS2_ARAHY|nr:hypothetical protein Ahy_B01g052172 isoform C [Arachis hypogaea]
MQPCLSFETTIADLVSCLRRAAIVPPAPTLFHRVSPLVMPYPRLPFLLLTCSALASNLNRALIPRNTFKATLHLRDTLQAAKDFLTFAADCSKIFMEERAILQNPANESQMKGIIRRLLSS